MSEHYVDIIVRETGATIKALGPYASTRIADKVQRGVEQNLDHSMYYTRTRDEGEVLPTPELTPSERAEVTRFRIHEDQEDES